MSGVNVLYPEYLERFSDHLFFLSAFPLNMAHKIQDDN